MSCQIFACLLFDSTKTGENSDISKCFEDFVSQALGFLTRNNAAEIRIKNIKWKNHDKKQMRMYLSDPVFLRDSNINIMVEIQTS